MHESLKEIGLVISITGFLGFMYLVFATIVEIAKRRKNKRRKPQDHYFAERKKKDD